MGSHTAGDGRCGQFDQRRLFIRRIDANGTISTFAGTGEAGFSGDGGPAVAAMIGDPSGLAIAPDGRIFFADRASHCVRLIDLSGVISSLWCRPGT
jgi:hypothetical protein